MDNLSHAFAIAPRLALRFPPGVRGGDDTSAGAASGTVNEFSGNSSSSLIRSGYRRPGSTVTAKTSWTAV